MSEPAFRLSQVTKRYADRVVLEVPELAFARHQTTVLIGPSGCGKSTLLRLLIGLISPDTGTVYIDGSPIEKKNLRACRVKVGYIIQDGGLFPHLTGRANATLMADHLKWPARRSADRVEELAELTHLQADVLDRYPSEMSGGQRQRVSLIRALMLDPEALLFDEPLGALDPLIRFDLQNDLADIFRRLTKSVVVVTHDLSEAVHFADTLVLLRDGRVEQAGAPDEVLARPASAFAERFIQAQRPSLTLSTSRTGPANDVEEEDHLAHLAKVQPLPAAGTEP